MAIKVDLLPTERKKFGFDFVIAIMVVLVIAAAVGFYFYGVDLQNKADESKKEVTKLQSELDEKKKGLEEINKLNKQIKDVQDQTKLVKQLKLDPVRYSNLLDELALLLPNNMWVTNISIEPSKQTMVLTGLSAEQPGVRPVEAVSGFMKNVGKSKFFKSAAIANANRQTVDVGKNKYTDYAWSIELIYDPEKAMLKE